MSGGELGFRSMFTDAPADRGVHRWITALILLSIIGIADSAYLLSIHGRSTALSTGRQGSAFCPASSCEAVNQSGHSEVAGIPLAALGLVGYLMLLVLSVLASWLNGRSSVLGIVMLSGVGVSVSAYLVYLQVAVIAAICSWCVLSALTMTLIFAVSVAMFRRMRSRGQPRTAGQQRAF